MKYQLKVNGKTYLIERKQDGYYLDTFKLNINNSIKTKVVDHFSMDEGLHFKIDGQFYKASLEKITHKSAVSGVGTGQIISPMNGIVYSVDCQLNAQVKKGEKLITIEAMKMLYPIFADKDGKVTQCQLSKGTAVKSNQILIKIE